MDSGVVVTMAFQPQAPQAEAFETYFRESVRKIREEKQVSEDVRVSLYRPVEAGQEFVWMTRFPEEELRRVDRAARRFLVRAMLDVLRDTQRRFAASVSVVSSSVLTAEGLVDQWNERHGQFKKMSLET